MPIPEHPPEAVVKAALMHPVPCATCGSGFACDCTVSGSAEYRLNWQADLIVQALHQEGHLTTGQPDEPQSIEDLARWLAEESMHARYFDQTGADPDRWRVLLESVGDVTVAHAAALRTHPQPSREYEIRLSDARNELLRYATGTARRRAEGAG